MTYESILAWSLLCLTRCVLLCLYALELENPIFSRSTAVPGASPKLAEEPFRTLVGIGSTWDGQVLRTAKDGPILDPRSGGKVGDPPVARHGGQATLQKGVLPYDSHARTDNFRSENYVQMQHKGVLQYEGGDNDKCGVRPPYFLVYAW